MRKKLRETFPPYCFTQLVYQALQVIDKEAKLLMSIQRKLYELVPRNKLDENEEQRAPSGSTTYMEALTGLSACEGC